jgi:hypothetical protein
MQGTELISKARGIAANDGYFDKSDSSSTCAPREHKLDQVVPAVALFARPWAGHLAHRPAAGSASPRAILLVDVRLIVLVSPVSGHQGSSSTTAMRN